MDSSNIILGKRKVKERFVNVRGGHTVLKSNMYSLESGEPSVWDKELGSGVTTRGVERKDYTEFLSENISHTNGKVTNKSSKRKGSGDREMSEKDVIRRDHNADVKLDQQIAQERRKRFVKMNWDLIKQFVQCTLPTDDDVAKMENLPMYTPLTEQPKFLENVKVRDYQLAGINWLIEAYNSGISVILGDEMGLGKTLQTIAYLGWMKFEQNMSGPFLVVVPLSVFPNWRSEFSKFLPQMRVLMLHTGDVDERERLRKKVLPNLLSYYDVVVTTYEMVKNPVMKHTLITSFYWRCVVLDEGHIVRNENSLIAKAIRKMHFQQAILLTGTPLQNNLHELWSLLNFLQPEMFPSSDLFDDCFDIRNSAKYRVDKDMLMKVHAMLKPFMLRRIKANVEKGVPPKVEKKILCPLSAIQSTWYKRFLLKDSTLLMQLELEEYDTKISANRQNKFNPMSQKSQWKRLNMLYMQLRKICNHPFMFPEADPHPDYTDYSIIDSSGKMQVLDRLLIKLKAGGHRVVLFSQFTSVLDILEDYINLRGFQYCRLDGGTNRVQRQVHIGSFNRKGSPLFIFLMSTRAGGLGVNLQTADTVILYDSDWNPQADLQAMARVHRIGQKKVVHVYRLVSAGTVEERIVQRAEKKLYLDQMVNRDGIAATNFDNVKDEDDGGLDAEELLKMLKFGADVICQSAGKQLSDADIDTIVSRSGPQMSSSANLTNVRNPDSGSHEECRIMNDQQHSALDFNPVAAPMETRIFQGNHYEKQGPCEEIMKQPFVQQRKRQRVERIVEVKDSEGKVHQVFKDNMYDMQQGITSVFDQEYAHDASMQLKAKIVKKKKYRAGHDYDNEDFCLRCWDGGSLICCDICPASYHSKCLSKGALSKRRSISMWTCPLHRCYICERSPAAAGGLLFRCSMCPTAYCDEHMPAEAIIINHCERLGRTCGYKTQNNACYIHCSKECMKWAEEQGEKDVQIEIEEEEETKEDVIIEDAAAWCPSFSEQGDESRNDEKLLQVDNENPKTSEDVSSFTDIVDSLENAAEDGVNVIERKLLHYRLPLCFTWIRCEGCGKFHSSEKCPTNFSMVKDMEQGDLLSLQECQQILLNEILTQKNYCAGCKTIIKGGASAFAKHEKICFGGKLIDYTKHGFRVQDCPASLSLPTFRFLHILPRFAESVVSLLEEKILEIDNLPNGDRCINISGSRLPDAIALVEKLKSAADKEEIVQKVIHDDRENHKKRVQEVKAYILNMLNKPAPVPQGKGFVWGGYHSYRPFAMSWAQLFSVFKSNTGLRSKIGGRFNSNDKLRTNLQDVVCELYESGHIIFIDHESFKVLSKPRVEEFVDDTRLWQLTSDTPIVMSLPVSASRTEAQYVINRKIEQCLKNQLLLHLEKVKRMFKNDVIDFFKCLAVTNRSPAIRKAYPETLRNSVIPVSEYYFHPVLELPKRSFSALATAIVEMLQHERKIEVLLPQSAGYIIKRSQGMVNEDHCLICADGGDLVCCDSCPASYHWDCLAEESRPSDDSEEEWACPRHVCSDCGRSERELLEARNNAPNPARGDMAGNSQQINGSCDNETAESNTSVHSIKSDQDIIDLASDSEQDTDTNEKELEYFGSDITSNLESFFDFRGTERIKISIRKSYPSEEIGVTLASYDDEKVLVADVTKGTLASRWLKANDWVLAVNAIPATTDNFMKIMNECASADIVYFTVCRESNSTANGAGGSISGSSSSTFDAPSIPVMCNNDEKVEIILKKSFKNQKLGLTLSIQRNRVIISSIMQGSLGYRWFKEQDVIIAVNGIPGVWKNFQMILNECDTSDMIEFKISRPRAHSADPVAHTQVDEVLNPVLICCTECTRSYCSDHLTEFMKVDPQPCDQWERVRILCNFKAPSHVKYAPCSGQCKAQALK